MIENFQKLKKEFFIQDVLIIAEELIGKLICRKFENNEIKKYRILKSEAYCGILDKTCHACKGKTKRTKIMFSEGGKIYFYLIYGIHWLLNIVTGKNDDAQVVLIRGIEMADGPGKVGKLLKIDKSFYGEDLINSNKIWIEDDGIKLNFLKSKRIGIDYSGEPWISKEWRFYVPQNKK